MKSTTILLALCCLVFISEDQNTQDSNLEVNSGDEEKLELVAASDEVEIYYCQVPTKQELYY